MDELVSSLRDADQRYKDAYTALLAEINAARDHHINKLAVQSAIQNLNDRHELWLLARKNLRDFMKMRLQEFWQLVTAHPNIAMDPNVVALSQDLAVIMAILKHKEHLHHLNFHRITRGFRDVIDTNAGDPNATGTAPVSPDNAQPRYHLVPSSDGQADMKSDTRHGDEAEVSQALADLDLNRPEPEETVEHDMAASEVLSDLDPNEKA